MNTLSDDVEKKFTLRDMLKAEHTSTLRLYQTPQLYHLTQMPVNGGNYSNFTENSAGVFQNHS